MTKKQEHSIKVFVVVDKEYDKDTIQEFIDDKDGEYDFGDYCILQLHESLRAARGREKDEQKKMISEYVDAFYQDNIADIEEAAGEMRRIWDDMEGAYLQAVSKVFGSINFLPEKNIIASPSITDCNDIKDDRSGFHIWYGYRDKPEYIRRLFAHELLHFFYYAYTEKRFSNIKDAWDLAEIFNAVVLNTKLFLDVTKKEEEGYPQHRKYLKYYETLWKQSKNLDEYLEKTIPLGLRA
jgi:hypothetical protein